MSAGNIEDKFNSLGGSAGFLSFPLDPESFCPDGIGKFRGFTHGSIYWHPVCGAHETHGAIRDKWSQSGSETGPLGYPISDETDWTAHDLLDMLPVDYRKWTSPDFAMGAWLDKEIVRAHPAKLGRWSKFEYGCITCWQDIKPPKGSEVWVWLKVGQYYIPKQAEVLPDGTVRKVATKARSREEQDKINQSLLAQVAELQAKVTGITENPAQAAELVAQSECRLLDEIMKLRDDFATLQAGNPQAEQDISKALLAKVVNDVKSQEQVRQARLISYAALILGIVAVMAACILYFR